MARHQPQSAAQRWLLYDGDCGFCRKWCDWAIRRGSLQAITFQSCQDARELRIRAGVPDDQCTRTAVFIECDDSGEVMQVSSGAHAINNVLARLPGSQNIFWRWLSWLYRVPILRELEELGYRIIARNRSRFGRTACRVDPD